MPTTWLPGDVVKTCDSVSKMTRYLTIVTSSPSMTRLGNHTNSDDKPVIRHTGSVCDFFDKLRYKSNQTVRIDGACSLLNCKNLATVTVDTLVTGTPICRTSLMGRNDIFANDCRWGPWYMYCCLIIAGCSPVEPNN